MNAKYLTGGNFVTGAHPVLSTGTTSTYTTAAILTASVNGVRGTPLAAQTNTASPTTGAVSGLPITLVANQSRAVVWCVNAAGAVAVVEGPVVDWINNVYTVAPSLPAIPDTLTPFAIQILRAGATAVGTQTFGSTAWAATGFTNAITNIYVLPDRLIS
jgi:hypothetical protein